MNASCFCRGMIRCEARKILLASAGSFVVAGSDARRCFQPGDVARYPTDRKDWFLNVDGDSECQLACFSLLFVLPF